MEALIKYWNDKFSPEELIEHIGISMEDLLYVLQDSGWVESNLNEFRTDCETIYGVGGVNE
jgi:hypothetical protein